MIKTTSKKSLTTNKTDYPFREVNHLLNKLTSIKNLPSSRNFYIILIIAGLLILAIYKKSWFIAATVNSSPVTNLDLQMRLNKDFRAQTLNELINERIILNEASKNNAVVSEEDVNRKISEIETSVGGKDALNALLSQQGQNRDTIKQQIKLRLTIEKLYEKDATVSADEVAKFIDQNKNQLRATDSAGQQKEAYDAIKNQKLTQIFSQKFQELRSKAKIQIF